MHPKWESISFILILLPSCVRYKPADFTLWDLTFLSAISEKEIRGWALCNPRTDRRSFRWFHKYSFPTEPPITQQIRRVFLQQAQYNMYQRWHVRFGAALQCAHQIRSPKWAFRLQRLPSNLLLLCGGFLSRVPLNFWKSPARAERSTEHRASLPARAVPARPGSVKRLQQTQLCSVRMGTLICSKNISLRRQRTIRVWWNTASNEVWWKQMCPRHTRLPRSPLFRHLAQRSVALRVQS